jgi:hypothetical protein
MQPDLESVLQTRFGHDQFRPRQREVIEHLLAGRSPWNRVRAFQRPAGAFWGPKASDGGTVGSEKRPGHPTAFSNCPERAASRAAVRAIQGPRRSIVIGFANIRLNRHDLQIINPLFLAITDSGRSTSDYRRER